MVKQQKSPRPGHAKRWVLVGSIVLLVIAVVAAIIVLRPKAHTATSNDASFTGSPVEKDVTLDVQKTIADANFKAINSQFGAATNILDAAIANAKSDPDKGALYAAKADTLTASGDQTGAISAAERAAQYAPSVPNEARLGSLYADAGQRTEAIKAYKTALDAYDAQLANGGSVNQTFGRDYYVSRITALGGTAS